MANGEGVTSDGRAPKMAMAMTCRFRASLNHKNDGQIKFIKPNSQR